MKLSERLDARRADGGEPMDPFSPATYTAADAAPASLATRAAEVGAFPPLPAAPAPTVPGTGLAQRGRPAPMAPQALDPVGKLKEQATAQLFERIGARLNEGALDEEMITGLVRMELNAIIEESATPLIWGGLVALFLAAYLVQRRRRGHISRRLDAEEEALYHHANLTHHHHHRQ